MNKEKSLKIGIFNKEYTLVSDESEHQVMKAADVVDTLMKEIHQQAKTLPEDRIAVLAALRLASKLLAIESRREHDIQKKKEIMTTLDKHIAELS